MLGERKMISHGVTHLGFGVEVTRLSDLIKALKQKKTLLDNQE
jgi:hypothetical protein